MIRSLLFLLFFIMLMADTLGWNLSLAPGISVKNGFLYLIFAAIAVETALSRNRSMEMMSVIIPYSLLIAYAVVGWLLMVLIFQNPQYSVMSTAINLKGGLADHILVFLVYFYGTLKTHDALWLIKSFLWIFIVVNILSVIDYFNVPDLGLVFEIHDGRMRGPIDEPNQYACYLLMFMPAGLVYALNERGLRKGLILFGVAMSGVALLTTASRGGFVGLVVGSVIAAYLLRDHMSARTVMRTATGLVLLFFVTLVTTLVSGNYDATFGRLIGQTTSGNVFDASSGRTFLWAAALEEMFARPMSLVAGFAWDSYRQLFDFRMAPHNSFLKILFELGLIGLVLLTITYANVIASVRKSLPSFDGVEKQLLIAFVFGLVSYLVAIFFVDIHSPWLFVWAFAGSAIRVVANKTAEVRAVAKEQRAASLRY